MTPPRVPVAAAAAIASALVAITVASRTHQGFYSDAALQMKTVVQFVDGVSPRVNDWTRPDYADLARDADERLVVWAPGTPLAFFPFVRAGLTPAAAARTVAALALIAGAAGWTLWFAAFGLPWPLVIAFAILVPWLRVASNALFLYNAEVLVFATVPWVLLAAVAADRARTVSAWLAAIGLGFAAGLLYVVKYSATFVTAAVLAWSAWRVWRSGDEPRWPRVARLVLIAGAAALPVVVLSVFNRQGGGSANLITATLAPRWNWLFVLHAVAFPALTAGDLDSLLTYVLLHPVHGVTHNAIWLTIVAVPGGVCLLLLAFRTSARGAAPSLARTVFAVSIAAILTVWSLSTTVSVEPRHLMSAGMAMLPLAIAEGLAWRRAAAPSVRRLLAAVAAMFVAAPFGYGVVSVFAKVARYPADYRTATSHAYNPLLAPVDAAAVAEALAATFDPSRDVWYVTDPLTALDLPGRAIVRHADFIPLPTLRGERFLSSSAMRVRVLLPARFEENGKGAAIRASFPQATRWTSVAVPGAGIVDWTGMLAPFHE
jgi:hypothetical protein